MFTWEEADSVLVTPVRHTGAPAICPLSGTPLSQDPRDARLSKEEDSEELRDGTKSDSENQDDDGLESEDGRSSSSESPPENDRLLREEGVTPEEDAASEDHDAEELTTSGGGSDDGVEGGGTDSGYGAPSFVYQRRKFVLKTVGDGEGEGSGERSGEKKTFGLVELPVGWKLGR